ncbi:class I SAM-dependent methyltransferase [Roseomonas sp. SSH11]|uniref:Class I SAM-dependent methyltransferase n=1 Tax=Pararoseomonas baculiformis TaxID=2820812 RepID=A0ABS4AHD2_9PROT|nr:class I SAM-dependent methyltransferase [Pararoseomonas baculiformis]MBP0446442.1 class I SAM-dependent methyltransferase [Pararoseomonas baculiformis]
MTPDHALSQPLLDRDAGSLGGHSSSLSSLYDEAELYDAIVQPGPCEGFYREEAARWGGPILELACGTGRLTLPLAAHGHEVVGLDNSRPMLAAAARKAADQGLPASFVLGDMREFDLGRRFGLIVISCNSLAHLHEPEDLRACLASVRRHLEPGGALAFDVVLPDPGLLAQPEGAPRRLDLGPNPSSAIQAEEVARYDPVAQVRVSHWHIRDRDGRERQMAPLALRQFFPREIPLLLEASGLELVERYGDFARNPLGRLSLNQICLARMAPGGGFGQAPFHRGV